MLAIIRLNVLALALAAFLGAGGGTVFAEAEYLRLRPPKEPTCADTSDKDIKCPTVQAPRINKRRSTIPGIQNPDHGRPPVIVDPLGRRSKAPIQIFGNPGISGN